jgi:hypothetical protein
METDVYVKEPGNGIVRIAGAEIIDMWEAGCLIRSEEELPEEAGRNYYVEEDGHLVAVHFPAARQQQGPFDYAAQKVRTDTRKLPAVSAALSSA